MSSAGGSLRPLRILLLPLTATIVLGQNYPNIPGQFSPVTLADEFFNHNYVNFFAFGTGTYDTNTPTLQNGQSTRAGGFGYAVGGGVSGYHSFRSGAVSFVYSGDYRDSSSLFFTSGTDENLSIAITKRLSRRWTFSASGSAGIIFYGTAYIAPTSSDPGIVQSNPFSSQSRFVATGLNFTYQQSRRLSYFVGGSYYIQRYNFPGSIGASGGTVSGGLNYRLTPRLTVGGTYSHSDFVYQRGAGETLVDAVYGSVTYQFPEHWTVSASGGLSHTDVSGTVAIPVSLVVNGQGVGGYVLGNYDQKSNLPSFNGSVSKGWRRSGFSIGAGQGVISGNGFFLAARNQYVGGSYSYSWRRANLSAGGNYYRLKSVANQVSSIFENTSFGASYGYQLYRHVGTTFRYDFVRYSNLAPYPSVSDNRLSFGISFSTKRIPLTLY
jgi:hypothetical protein